VFLRALLKRASPATKAFIGISLEIAPDSLNDIKKLLLAGDLT
jgi:hypothetical protein